VAHVARQHAIVGTPTVDGNASPRRTAASLREPLMALCEIAYADALLPLLDEAAVAKSEWGVVDEKLEGIVGQITLHVAHYALCEQHLVRCQFSPPPLELAVTSADLSH
jgi:hypothetical protein